MPAKYLSAYNQYDTKTKGGSNPHECFSFFMSSDHFVILQLMLHQSCLEPAAEFVIPSQAAIHGIHNHCCHQ